MTIECVSLDQLAQRCAEETERFSRRQPHDTQFCFELLRRGLAEGVPEALTWVYRIYERQVVHWVYAHSRFLQAGESAEYFASAALSAFYFALRGAKFADFSTLPQVLQYLKVCVHSAITQYVRDQQTLLVAPLDIGGVEIAQTTDLLEQAYASDVWAEVQRVLSNEEDVLLARCVFLHDLKPRQIVALYPQCWASEREVSVAIYRIRRLLRSNSALRHRVDEVC